MKETEQHIGSFAQGGEMLVQFSANILLGLEHRVLDRTLDISMTELFWVDFWRIGWQEFNRNFRMFGEIGFHPFASMRARTIPNDDKRSRDLATEMFQALNHLFGIDGTFKMLLVDFA